MTATTAPFTRVQPGDTPQRQVGDAIVLERATKVLLRRGHFRPVVAQELQEAARALRAEAEGEQDGDGV